MSPTLTVSYTDPTCALPIILLLLSRFHFSRRYQSVTFPSNALSPGAYIAVLLIHDPLQPQSSIYDLFSGLQMSSEINVYHESASASCLRGSRAVAHSFTSVPKTFVAFYELGHDWLHVDHFFDSTKLTTFSLRDGHVRSLFS